MYLPSSGAVRLGLGGVPVTGCRSNDKCNSNNLPERLFRDRRSNSPLSNKQSSRPVFGKSSDFGIGHNSNCFTHHFNHDAMCSLVQSRGSGEKKMYYWNIIGSFKTHHKSIVFTKLVQIRFVVIVRTTKVTCWLLFVSNL